MTSPDDDEVHRDGAASPDSCPDDGLGCGSPRRQRHSGVAVTSTAEIRDAGRYAGDVLADIVRSIGHTHLSISRRVFDAIGPRAARVRVVHDTMSQGAYTTVAAAHAAAPRAGALLAAGRSTRRREDSTRDERIPQPHTTRVLGILNGLKGDTIARKYPGLAFSMALRNHADGGDVPPTRPGLASAYPAATDRVALFVHGLCETDRSWWDGADKHHGDPSLSYGNLLQAELGFTSTYLRYNSGLPVQENGRALAELLDQIVDGWPVPVRDLVLIGHSMGGLVARTACHDADVSQRPWASLVRHVICVGTPHLGAPLEQGIHRLVPVLARIPETRPLAAMLRDRSAGVKDLRHGVFAADEYHGDDLDEYLAHRRREVPFLEGATYCFVGATITHDRHHPIGHLVGDLLVRYPSASGSSRRRNIPFELEHGVHVGGINHFDLLNHPTVYEHLRRWLTPRRHELRDGRAHAR